MAEYIDDSGVYNKDALFSGTKGTDYDYDETEEAVWFSDTGTCDTDFVLPDIPWVMFEVYAMTGTGITNSLSGSTQLQGKKEWTSDLTAGIASTLSTWKTAYGTPYTTYKVKATHYKTAGGDVADVYFADEGEGFTITGGTEEGVADGDLVLPATTWKMSDALYADGVGSIEYVDNGDFVSDVSGWTSDRDAVITWDSGRAKITQGGLTWGNMEQEITGLSDAVTYTLSIDGEIGFISNTHTLFFSLRDASNGDYVGTSSDEMFGTETTTYDFSPESGETSVFLDVGIGGGSANTTDHCWVDNISIKVKT